MDPVVKQQAAERLRQANHILVTVSANPSVDQLAAAIGTTLLLNKQNKHATAIFSGTVPSILEFLQPEKTIEHSVDNLRDFIISLDKSKADKLHFKVESDVVRIYITPFRTTITDKDLTYSLGDYNVDVILALGVQNRSQIDTALSAHGRILHDATTIAVTAGAGKPSDVGQINWQDSSASSLCEMIISMSESFGSGLIDAQMATAFLTGIVAETERFRNTKTTPKVMTMSAQLMAAGANQQLIASKLELDKKPPAEPPKKPVMTGQEATIQLDHSDPAAHNVPKATVVAQAKKSLPTKPEEKVVEPPASIKIDTPHIRIDRQGNVTPVEGEGGNGNNFVPAPPEFTPPPASPLSDDAQPPSEHTLLDPAHHQPTFSPPISADGQPNWTDGSGQPAESAILGESEAKQEADDQAKSLDAARAEVENVLNPVGEATGQSAKSTASPTPKNEEKPPESPHAPTLPPPIPTDLINPSPKQ